jgi:hypothetical protein
MCKCMLKPLKQLLKTKNPHFFYLDEVPIVSGGVEQDHGTLRAGLELEENVPASQTHLKGGQLDHTVLENVTFNTLISV